jgi:co-chaperonin GroES (HSP10)
MQGVVEVVGPGRRSKRDVLLPLEVEVGMTVMFPAEAGRARLPWDYPVRIMRESELSGVVEV